MNGLVVTYEWSFRLVAPFTHKPSGWEIFEQLHADDAKFGQAPFRFQSSPARDFFRLSIDSGEFPTSGDATAGTNAGTNLDLDVFEMVEGEWLDCRLTVYWTRNASGYVLFDIKRESEDVFTRTEALGIQTLPTILGDASTTNIYDKLGPYRPDWTAPDGGVGPATWNVDYCGGR